MNKRILLVLLSVFLLSNFSCSAYRVYQVEIITPEKKIVHPINLDAIIIVQGKISEVSIEIQNNRARIKSSSCPDQICVKTGWISQSYEFILCAPNQVIVRIISLPNRRNRLISY